MHLHAKFLVLQTGWKNCWTFPPKKTKPIPLLFKENSKIYLMEKIMWHYRKLQNSRWTFWWEHVSCFAVCEDQYLFYYHYSIHGNKWANQIMTPLVFTCSLWYFFEKINFSRVVKTNINQLCRYGKKWLNLESGHVAFKVETRFCL